jgi:hypothetical protein
MKYLILFFFVSCGAFDRFKTVDHDAIKRAKDEKQFQLFKKKYSIKKTMLLKKNQNQEDVEGIFGSPVSMVNTSDGTFYFYNLLSNSDKIIPYVLIFKNNKLLKFKIDTEEAKNRQETARRNRELEMENKKLEEQKRSTSSAIFLNAFGSKQTRRKRKSYNNQQRTTNCTTTTFGGQANTTCNSSGGADASIYDRD